MNQFEIDPLWLLAEEVSLQDAVALVAGYNPNAVKKWINGSEFHEKFPKYYPVHTAISNAVRCEVLNATIRYQTNPYDEDVFPEGVPDILLPTESYMMHDDTTTIAVSDLRNWLQSRGIITGFFFPQSGNTPNYLDPTHPCYSSKLAAAVQAWQAVVSDSRFRENGKSVKKNLENWLTAHAFEFNLTNVDGELNNDAIQNQISKVANCESQGGAPKTPKRKGL